MDADIELSDYEDCPISGRVYSNVHELVNTDPNIKTDKRVIVFLTNWMYGFGSALTIYMQNALFLKDVNPNIIALPHYSTNTKNFKYHDERLNNSFFLYYKYTQESERHVDIRNSKIYFVKSVLLQTPFVSGQFPILADETNVRFIDFFRSQFILRPNENDVASYMQSIRRQGKELIGIHIRSIAQKQNECPGYLNVTFEKRLVDLKQKIEEIHPNAVLFIASDVELYIENAKKLFGDFHYLDYITRIENEGDSIPQLEAYKGYKLGCDILDDCLALSLCDKIYISNSNIPFIITLMNKEVPMEEY